MNIRRIIERRIRRSFDGTEVASDVNVVVAANIGESGATTAASHAQHDAERPHAHERRGGTDEQGS